MIQATPWINTASPYLSLISSFVSILTFSSAIFVTIQSVRGRNLILEWALRRNRVTTIGFSLSEYLGIRKKHWKRACRTVSKMIATSGEKRTVASEIEWLTKISISNNLQMPFPLEIYGVSASATRTEDSGIEFKVDELRILSKAYEDFSKRLRAQVLLSGNLVMQEQAELALQVASYLTLNANFLGGGEPAINWMQIQFERMVDVQNPKTGELHRRINAFDLELYNPKINSQDSYPQIDHVSALHIEKKSVSGAQKDYEWLQMNAPQPTSLKSSVEFEAIDQEEFNGRNFNGLLPALHHVHFQRDKRSGHRRLFLELSEIEWSTLKESNYVKQVFESGGKISTNYLKLLEEANQEIHLDRLITLSMIPISSDGYMVVSVRSQSVGVSKGWIAPGVVGSLELRDRLGVSVDRDSYGYPNLLEAIARESKEELGLSVPSESIHILGLGRFSFVEEVRTWVLLTSTFIDQTAAEIVKGSRKADRTEGAWELSGEFIGIPVPRSWEEAEIILKWAFNSSDLVPHLILTLMQFCMPLIGDHMRENKSFGLDEMHDYLESLISENSIEMPTGFTKLHRHFD
jgi:8-oxo-dGTP pyrophosphatase MutT (NUDIX family)